MPAAFLLLPTLGAFSLELPFVISLIGSLVVAELTAPFGVSPRWRRAPEVVHPARIGRFAYAVVRRTLNAKGDRTPHT